MSLLTQARYHNVRWHASPTPGGVQGYSEDGLTRMVSDKEDSRSRVVPQVKNLMTTVLQVSLALTLKDLIILAKRSIQKRETF